MMSNALMVFQNHRSVAVSTVREAKLRHAHHYGTILFRATQLYASGGNNVAKGLSLFDLEWPNIEAGQACVAKHAEEDENCASLCNNYPLFGVYLLTLRQHPRDQIRWLEQGLTAARRLNRINEQAKHLENLAQANAVVGNTNQAIELHEEALLIDRQTGDLKGEGRTLSNLGIQYARLGETDHAIKCYERSLK